jgi:ribosomal protein S18 acetylase RimI-like enzyme
VDPVLLGQQIVPTMRHALTLTLAGTADAEYLYRVTETTMRAYVEASFGEWHEDVQRTSIGDLVSRGQVLLIWLNGIRIGMMSVREQPTELVLDRLYLSPDAQGRGIGTQLLNDLVQRARSAGKPLRLRVLTSNPAKRLYERLGFVVTHTTPERYDMEFRS